jgi:ABC-type antimicrobial peptide transport system permease subunit
LAATPARFGATWDVSLSSSINSTEELESVLREPEIRRSIDQAAVITGVDLRIGDEQAWVHAFAPLDSVADEAVPTPIGSGRPPTTPREIALGALTLEDTGLSIGDTVTVSGSSTGEEFAMRIVGTTMINDTFEPSPGRGAVVTPAFIAEAAPEITGDPVVVSVTPTTDVGTFIAELREAHDGSVEPPVQQAAVKNVGRIRSLPYLVAAVIAVLAAASLVHALVLSVGRNRQTLGMLKGLGFTRRQVGYTVAWHASSYALVAIAVALPFGVIAGRWAWRLVAESLGVPAVPVVPVSGLVLIAAAVVVLANLAAAYPAWRAARLSSAAALRAE